MKKISTASFENNFLLILGTPPTITLIVCITGSFMHANVLEKTDVQRSFFTVLHGAYKVSKRVVYLTNRSMGSYAI